MPAVACWAGAPRTTPKSNESSLFPLKTLIRVGHSPDPDDAFMFYALAKDLIDTGRYQFTHELVDIETLNRRAFSGELELTALSLHAYAYLADKYLLCTCGASMGDNYGPMVVARGRSIGSPRPDDCRPRDADDGLPALACLQRSVRHVSCAVRSDPDVTEAGSIRRRSVLA
jgi:hypothetical protein